MKTLKIPETIHQDLRRIQAEYGKKTFSETLTLIIWYFNTGKIKNDKK